MAKIAEEIGQSPPPRSNYQRKEEGRVDAGYAEGTAQLAKHFLTVTAIARDHRVRDRRAIRTT